MLKPIKNKYCNHSLGRPLNWSVERDGECGSLPCYANGREFFSWWVPTPEQIAQIQEGKPILLVVTGQSHPPVSISVDFDNEGAEIEVPQDAPEDVTKPPNPTGEPNG